MTVQAMTTRSDKELVRDVLEAAGERGASHEDFVEAGLARDYIGTLRQLVQSEGLRIRIDFTTGQPRWILLTDTTRRRRTA
ncbi:MAG TPA: hypothetical protein VE570_02015 [Thermoleophilaceae bacterium]|jgi:hypothetical protein|nr:hypothetical protein [Thermoleophilaceae bacterium]